MTETPYPAEQRLGDDLALDPIHQPATYSGPREGQGAWCILYAGVTKVQLGYLWTTDTGLGFVPSSDRGVTRVPEFYQAFSKAAEAGTPARDVFDAWADLAGQGLSAGPVTTGDVATLPA